MKHYIQIAPKASKHWGTRQKYNEFRPLPKYFEDIKQSLINTPRKESK